MTQTLVKVVAQKSHLLVNCQCKLCTRYFLKKRYQKTLSILKQYAPQGSIILDVGVENPFSAVMQQEGYTVLNTTGQDLDFESHTLQAFKADFTVALEFLEHLVNPLAVLQNLPTKRVLILYPCAFGLPKPTAIRLTPATVIITSLKIGNWICW